MAALLQPAVDQPRLDGETAVDVLPVDCSTGARWRGQRRGPAARRTSASSTATRTSAADPGDAPRRPLGKDERVAFLNRAAEEFAPNCLRRRASARSRLPGGAAIYMFLPRKGRRALPPISSRAMSEPMPNARAPDVARPRRHQALRSQQRDGRAPAALLPFEASPKSGSRRRYDAVRAPGTAR